MVKGILQSWERIKLTNTDYQSEDAIAHEPGVGGNLGSAVTEDAPQIVGGQEFCEQLCPVSRQTNGLGCLAHE